MLNINAGPIQVYYEKGFLRYIKAEGNEIVRMIYFALRDENWTTLPMRIEKENLNTDGESFNVQYEAINFLSDEDIFHWHCNIHGKKSGEIIFEISGEALTDMKKNRAGFCVLHPLKESIHEPVTIFHPDGSITNAVFPEDIAAEDPFKLIKAMRWKVRDKWYSLRFEGDLFETEDQRNWGDASFKTFCTPLEIPFPVSLKKGDQVHQKVSFKSDSPIIKTTAPEKIEISISKKQIPFPAVGIHDVQADRNDKVVANIRKLGLSHLRIDVNPAHINWQTNFSTAFDRAKGYNVQVELSVTLSSNYKDELNSLINICAEKKYPVKQINLYSAVHLTTPREIMQFASEIKSSFPEIKMGAGTDFNFTELNRNRLNESELDFVTYSIDPQEHATDDRTLIENVAAQYYSAISAKKIYPKSEVHVSSIALKRRFNPYAQDIRNKICSEEERFDRRQTTQFCALWTLGSLKYLAEGGTSSVTYFQTVGPLGIMSNDGSPYPVYKAFELVSGLTSINPSVSSEPLKVDAICSSNELIVWNYTDERQDVHLSDIKQNVTLLPREIKIIAVAH